MKKPNFVTENTLTAICATGIILCVYIFIVFIVETTKKEVTPYTSPTPYTSTTPPAKNAEFWVETVNVETRSVNFWATEAWLEMHDLTQYGQMFRIFPGEDQYNLFVSGLYDFEEVVAYLRGIEGQ